MPGYFETHGTFSIVKKFFWGIVWVLFGAVLLLLLWLSFDKYILKSPVPSVFGYSTLTIATGSMNGNSALVEGGDVKQVDIGDLIVIKKTDDYKIGDVITFLKKGEKVPTTHRIIGYTDGGFITKGDANNTKDTVPVLQEEVLGEVVGHYPKLGKFASWVKNEGWTYLVAGLAILAIGSTVIKNADDDAESETDTTADEEDDEFDEDNDEEFDTADDEDEFEFNEFHPEINDEINDEINEFIDNSDGE